MRSLVRPSWKITIGLMPVLMTTAAMGATWGVTVKGSGRDLGETPLVIELKANIPAGNYRLERSSGEACSASVFEDGGKTFLGTVLDHVDGSQPERFTLRGEPRRSEPPRGIVIKPIGAANLEVRRGGESVLTYVSGEATKPYYFPVNGPTGAMFTRAYPMKKVDGEDRDHPHQRSLWFTHGNVNGVDFWASDPLNPPKPNYGTIRETSRKIVSLGGPVGVIRTSDDWQGPDGKTVCDDVRVVTIFDTKSVRILDVDVTVRAGAGDVTFGDTKEGMFGLRVASSMDVKNKQGGRITNAEGLTDDAAWGKASAWVDYTGPVDGKDAGIAILNHPVSFRYPTTWHVRTYGLFAANPFGWHDFGLKRSGEHTIVKGDSIGFRYRVVLHAGKVDVARLFDGYANPPVVEVVSD